MAQRITKQLAESVAKKMADNTIGIKIGQIRKQMSEKANEVILRRVPEILAKAAAKHKDYFNMRTTVSLTADSLPIVTVERTDQYPVANCNWKSTFECNREEYDFLKELEAQKNKLEEERKKLTSTVETTLYALKTEKNIREKFPEAIPFIPQSFFEERNDEISLPLESIKDMLKKYNEPE